MTIPGVDVEFAIDIGSQWDSFVKITVRMQQQIDGIPGTLEITQKIPINPDDESHGAKNFQSIIENHPLAQFRLCESPAEVAFYLSTWDTIHGIRPQVEIGPYRADFAITDKQIVVEIDGHEYHKTQGQRMLDYKRERYMQLNGWQIIRFTALEVFKDQFGCAKELSRIIESLSPKVPE